MRADAKWLFETLEAYDTIAIYRHVYADGDALGAQFGLKALIEERWPHKRVFALGKRSGSCAAFYPRLVSMMSIGGWPRIRSASIITSRSSLSVMRN